MEFNLDYNEKKLLLDEARESISSKLEGRKPSFAQIDNNSILKTPCGAFVSLHLQPGHNLRGCIGRMTANLPLIETVHLMAKEAAFGDPRFPPLRADELSRCNIEISALSPMSPCRDPQLIKIGVHGLFLKRDGMSGVFLPQVPVEQGWNLNEYLEHLCVKAYLPPGSWQAKDAELFTFTAVVFSER